MEITIDLMAFVYWPVMMWMIYKHWIPIAVALIIILGKLHLTLKWRRN